MTCYTYGNFKLTTRCVLSLAQAHNKLGLTNCHANSNEIEMTFNGDRLNVNEDALCSQSVKSRATTCRSVDVPPLNRNV